MRKVGIPARLKHPISISREFQAGLIFRKSFRGDVVLDLSDFLEAKVDGDKFFAENFITNGVSV
ncbi:hypothetical protein ACCAA_170001 [Candidatus Accumulibacter aalborgensis]|uniref:Uncharacterized protein n=1 Tax=Candidatus Accumulibacter aalborgensis TaxID=1860102 RepID=A0A1A8XKY8_9PROT|nr:hypothetical protein ACCAA_170001 [Candidatus Accumulibacter aalborgensis]